jgi:soluble lytic murein transglycosylase-like protein
MFTFRTVKSFLLVAVLSQILLASAALADIYRYEDEEGVIHFTDIPTDSKFKIFMRDIKKDKALRTSFKVGDPAEFEPLIASYATQYGIEKSLIKAVIAAESNYNPKAVSKKGASGLMQLMPKTAESLKVADCFNPSDNIRGGVRYLKFLLDTFKGDVALALAAYNAGMSNVAKYKGVPPFSETRNYIAKVMNYQRTYQSN